MVDLLSHSLNHGGGGLVICCRITNHPQIRGLNNKNHFVRSFTSLQFEQGSAGQRVTASLSVSWASLTRAEGFTSKPAPSPGGGVGGVGGVVVGAGCQGLCVGASLWGPWASSQHGG